VVLVPRLEAKLNKRWSSVGTKANRQWGWSAMEASTRQGIVFYVGERRQASAARFWANLPAVYREQALCSTAQDAVDAEVTPPPRHRALAKLARRTHPGERCNYT